MYESNSTFSLFIPQLILSDNSASIFFCSLLFPSYLYIDYDLFSFLLLLLLLLFFHIAHSMDETKTTLYTYILLWALFFFFSFFVTTVICLTPPPPLIFLLFFDHRFACTSVAFTLFFRALRINKITKI
jgi:hypothetical protein